ncbi:hypothetical protein [Streptomyces sparsus]
MAVIGAVVESAAGNATENDFRIAQFTARTALEPALAARYTLDPAGVLAEFGILSAEPVYAEAPMVIEDLSTSEVTARFSGICGVHPYVFCPDRLGTVVA